MPLWGSKDQANNAPKFKISARSPNTGIQVFASNTNISVVGLSDAEVGLAKGGAAHSGWQRVRRGAGPVVSVTVTSGGTLYANTDTIVVSGGSTNAAGTIVTNGAGVIQSVTLTNSGTKFANNSSAVLAITTATGSGATLTPVLGGRANRIQVETLVTQSNMTGNNSII